MINLQIWNKKNKTFNNSVLGLLKKCFPKKKSFDIINKETLIITFTIDNNIVGTFVMLPNNILFDYLNKKNFNVDSYVFRAQKGIFLYNLAVDKNYRGQKIGKKLIETAIYIAKRLNYNYCHVQTETDISYKIFKNKNFSEEGSFQVKKSKYDMSLKTVYIMSYWL